MTALSLVVVAFMASIPVSAGIVWLIGKDESGLRVEEYKTPYDYALTNAINERDRLQEELRTIRALKRTEVDTERIRNEIGTILSDDGEEATEDVFDGKEAYMRSCEATDEQFLRMIEWDTRITAEEMVDNISKAVARANGTNVREDDAKDEQLSEDDVEHLLIKEIAKKAVENLELAIEFAKMSDKDGEEIRKQLEETSEELSKETRELRRGIREFKEE